MCSITASFSTERIKELIEMNRYRGEFSHSITYLDTHTMNLVHVHRALGPINTKDIILPNKMSDVYVIVHQQAPTGDTNKDDIHPASDTVNYLWHNGILKTKTIEELQKQYDDFFLDPYFPKITWDTKLLLMHLSYCGYPKDIDGSFACLYYKGKRYDSSLDPKLYVFRNLLSPLFMDNSFTFSSTKFNGSYPVMPHHMFNVDLKNKKLTSENVFTTMENPYVGLE